MLTLERVNIEQGGFNLSADWSVKRGEKIGIIGPSGGGKTTLLSAIAGFIRPRSGRILFSESDMSNAPPHARPVSLLFQSHNLFPHLSVFQNVALGVQPNLRLTALQKTRVLAALARVGLGDKTHIKPAALSGGQNQRVALARVLLQSKPLMLLDEPFAGLGPALKADMLALVGQIAAETGATLLMVTHDPADALALAERTVAVTEGIAHAPQRTSELLSHPPSALAAYLG